MENQSKTVAKAHQSTIYTKKISKHHVPYHPTAKKCARSKLNISNAIIYTLRGTIIDN